MPLSRGVTVVQDDKHLEIKYSDAGLEPHAGRRHARAPREHGHGRHQGLREEARAAWRRLSRRRAGQGPEPDARLLAPGDYPIPEGITIETPTQTEIVIKGIDRQKVGQVAAEIRDIRPPEPYKGKGVRYAGEQITLKEGEEEMRYMTKERAAPAPRRQDARPHPRAWRGAPDRASHPAAHLCAGHGCRGRQSDRGGFHRAGGVSEGLKGTGNVEAAKAVGRAIAERTKAAGISKWLRPCRFPVPRARESAGRCGPRSGSGVLSRYRRRMAESRKKRNRRTSSSRSSSRSTARRKS